MAQAETQHRLELKAKWDAAKDEMLILSTEIVKATWRGFDGNNLPLRVIRQLLTQEKIAGERSIQANLDYIRSLC